MPNPNLLTYPRSGMPGCHGDENNVAMVGTPFIASNPARLCRARTSLVSTALHLKRGQFNRMQVRRCPSRACSYSKTPHSPRFGPASLPCRKPHHATILTADAKSIWKMGSWICTQFPRNGVAAVIRSGLQRVRSRWITRFAVGLLALVLVALTGRGAQAALDGKVALTAPKSTTEVQQEESEPSHSAVDALDRRIRELERGREELIASAQQQQKRANDWIGILGALVVLLLAWNVWHRAGQIKFPALSTKQPKHNTRQAENGVKLNETLGDHSTWLRKQIASMAKVEREYGEAIEQLRQGAREQKQDGTIAELERSAWMFAQQLQHLVTQATKSGDQLEKLRARLRQAESGDSRVDPRNSKPGGILLPVS